MKHNQGASVCFFYPLLGINTNWDTDACQLSQIFLWESLSGQLNSCSPPLIQSDRSKDQEQSITTRQLKNLKLIQAIKPPLYFSLATPCWQTECHPSHCCLFLYWLIYYKWKCYKIAIRRGLGGINLEWTNHCGTEWKIKASGYVSVGKENKQVPFLNR